MMAKIITIIVIRDIQRSTVTTKHWLPNTETSSSSSFIMHLPCAKYFIFLYQKFKQILERSKVGITILKR